jgi:hypothetical protein
MTVRHGESRNHRDVTAYGGEREYIDAITGQVIYSGPAVSHTRPTCERWCEECQEWKPQRGILATLAGCPTCGADW